MVLLSLTPASSTCCWRRWHGETGLLAAEKNSDDLAEKSIKMLEDRELQAATVAAGRRLIAEHYTWPGIAKRFEALFEQCLADEGARAQLTPQHY